MRDVYGTKIDRALFSIHHIRMTMPRKLRAALDALSPKRQFLEFDWHDKAKYGNYYILSDEATQRVEILLGPYAYTYYLIWVYQQVEASMEVN